MPYIESDLALPRHHKTKRAAKLLNTTRSQIVGSLHFLWAWAMDNALSGDLTGFDADELAEESDWPGDAAEFVNALLTCGKMGHDGQREAGFLEKTPEGRLIIHDWYEHGGGKLADHRDIQAYKVWIKRNSLPDTQENFDAWKNGGKNKRRQTSQAPQTEPAPSVLPVVPTSQNVANTSRDIFLRENDVAQCHYIEQQSVAERSEEQQQRSEEESARGETETDACGVPAAAADAYGAGEMMPKASVSAPSVAAATGRFTIPKDENPRVWVDKMLAVSPKHWASELQKRYGAANAKGTIRSEWPWKARLLADWLNGDEPPPDAPASSKPPPRVQSPQATEEARRLSDEAVNAAKEASRPKIAEIQAQLAEKLRLSGSAPPSANKSAVDYSAPNNLPYSGESAPQERTILEGSS